ncbi:MAG: nitrogen fixation protein NifQ [Gammaproteobacteria bacterium]|jgi:nitrogen fixation protein NifQ|nr:nitrogen fixation protein NifQ [Gammaproteobacteria bacterium]MBU0769934.1 nitrogen fixation protein NifQ [Gammaproteobacteria bacterium]MBU0856261.1 nitrogen fixation protein NifQ [Gammaproteobacteria bacterium]MBU1847786.1 nitrogen fixation protein NifQ [Gammaproteobacteria bacterium]
MQAGAQSPSSPLAEPGQPPGRGTYRGMLLKLARRPDALIPQVLAGVIGRSWHARGLQALPLYGIDLVRTRRVLARHFPGSETLPALHAAVPEEHAEAIEMDDVVALLLENLTRRDEDNEVLAHAVASACLGSDHLWQDMQLASRRQLSELMGNHFTTLAARNAGDMKWKKFLYKQLCEREEIRVCKAPSCGVCTDYDVCFGPEEGAPAT